MLNTLKTYSSDNFGFLFTFAEDEGVAILTVSGEGKVITVNLDEADLKALNKVTTEAIFARSDLSF